MADEPTVTEPQQQTTAAQLPAGSNLTLRVEGAKPAPMPRQPQRGRKGLEATIDEMHEFNRCEMDGWKIDVAQTSPQPHIVDDVPQGLPYTDLKNFIKCHGPGVYRITARDGAGRAIASKCETIIERGDPRMMLAAAQAGGAANIIGSDDSAELQKARVRKAKAEVEAQAVKAEAELEDVKDARQKAKEKEERKSERAEMDAMDKMLELIKEQREEDRRKEEQREQREEQRRREEREFQRGLFEALSKKAEQPPTEPVSKQLAALLTAASPILAPVIEAIAKTRLTPQEPQKAIDPLESAMKLLQALGTQQETKQAHEVKLLDKLLDSRLNAPTDNLAAIREAEERSESRMMWLWEQAEKARERAERNSNNGSDDDLNLDPNNLWGSGVVALIRGLYTLVKEGGPAMAQLISAHVQKPADQITPQDLAPLAERLQQLPRPTQRQLPVATNPPQRRPQQQQQPAFQPTAAVWQTLDGANAPPQPPPVIPNADSPHVPSSTAVIPSAAMPPQAPIAPISPPSSVPLAPPVAAPTIVLNAPPDAVVTGADLVDDMRQDVELTVKDIIIDCRQQREEHTWHDAAFRTWPKALKEQFAQVGASQSRPDEPYWWQIAKMKELCDPKLWSEVEPLIALGTEEGYKFRVALTAFVDALQGKIVVVAPPPAAEVAQQIVNSQNVVQQQQPPAAPEQPKPAA